MQTMHIFAGAGGGLLADLISGHEPVCAVEWEAWCCDELRRRKDAGWFPGLHVHEGDVRLFDPSPWRGRVDCIHAGFPCEDVSAAGKGEGIYGEASGLVREVLRVVQSIRPQFVFLENSPRIRSRGRRFIIRSLLALGYAVRDGTLKAADVGAWHDRERWWLLAANIDGLRQLQPQGVVQNERGWTHNSSQAGNVADPMRQGFPHDCGLPTSQKIAQKRPTPGVGLGTGYGTQGPMWFEVEPNVDRLVYGLADGHPSAVKAHGKGQVPLCASLAWRLLGGPTSQ